MTKVNLGKDTSGRPLVLDATTLAKIRQAEAQIGWKFAIIQGSYMKGFAAAKSGTTHNEGGAVDLRTWDIPKSIGITRVLTALRQAGLIAWYRPQSAFPDHEIHAIDYGNPNLSSSARDQVTSYLAGRNGLSGSLSGPDDGPKVTIPKNGPGEETPMGARVDGVDISHWQNGSLDFAKAKAAGARWAFHKATEGIGYTDPNYSARVAQIRASGLRAGAYHFAKPAASGGKAQAVYFLSVAKVRPGDMRPMLDLEDRGGLSRAKLTAWVGAFVAECVKQTGVAPLCYTPFDLDSTFDCPLWVARYSNAMSAPKIPAPWSSYSIWQFTNGVYGSPKSVPGLGNVDANTMNGDPAALTDAFTLGRTVPDKIATPLEDDLSPEQYAQLRADITADVQKIVESTVAKYVGDVVPRPGVADDAKNPTWWAKNAIGDIWADVKALKAAQTTPVVIVPADGETPGKA